MKKITILFTLLFVLSGSFIAPQKARAITFPRLFGVSQTCPTPRPPEAERYRCAPFNADVLLDSSGDPIAVSGVKLNFFGNTPLFPLAIYNGVVETAEQTEYGYVWEGYLDGIEYSYFYIVYTANVFIVHAASPLGVYEASFASSNLYKLIKYYDFGGE